MPGEPSSAEAAAAVTQGSVSGQALTGRQGTSLDGSGLLPRRQGATLRKAVITQQAIARSCLSKHKSRHPPPVGLLNSAKQHTDHKCKHSECFQERSPLLQQDVHQVRLSWPSPAGLKCLLSTPAPHPAVQEDVNSAGGGERQAGVCSQSWEMPLCSPFTPVLPRGPVGTAHHPGPTPSSRPLCFTWAALRGSSRATCRGEATAGPLAPGWWGRDEPESHLRSRQHVSPHKGRCAPRYNFPFSSHWWRCL